MNYSDTKITSYVEDVEQIYQSGQNNVLFYADDVNARLLKLAWALRSTGWKIALIHTNKSFFDYSKYFDASIHIDDHHLAYDVAARLKPQLYHVFAGAIDQRTVHFCANKPGITVLDIYDLWSHGLMRYCPERYSPTLEAVSLADALCVRDKRYEIAHKKDGMLLPENILLFPDYCWGKDNFKIAPSPKHPGEVHVASVGSISLDEQFLRMMERLVGMGIHVHLYPRWHFAKSIAQEDMNTTFRAFFDLSQRSKFMHVHEPVPLDKLYSELTGYDFGMLINGYKDFGYDPEKSVNTEDCIATCFGMRVSDYIECGLPVITNSELNFICNILKNVDMFVDAHDIFNIGFKEKLLIRKNDSNFKSITESARDKFSLQNNAAQLNDFYNSVIQHGITNRSPYSNSINKKQNRTKYANIKYNENIYPNLFIPKISKSKFTLIIPTYNRSIQLCALLQFFQNKQAEFKIIVLDSSSDPEERSKNLLAINGTKLDIQYYEFDSSIAPFEKIWHGSIHVKTPYCGMCADDDLVMPDSLDPLISFLEDASDYAAAQGWYYRFHLQGENLELHRIDYWRPSLNNDDPLLRLREFFNSYESLNYAVYRTSLFVDIFSKIRVLDNVWAHETLSCALTLASGKVARLPVFFYGRFGGPALDLGPCHPIDFMVTSIQKQLLLYLDSREILIEQLMSNYPGRYTADQWGQFINLIYWMYFSDFYKKNTLNNAFEYCLQHESFDNAPINANIRMGICPISFDDPIVPAPQLFSLKAHIIFKAKNYVKTSKWMKPFVDPVLRPLWRILKQIKNRLASLSAKRLAAKLKKKSTASIPASVQTYTPAPSGTLVKTRTSGGILRYYYLSEQFRAELLRNPIINEPANITALIGALNNYEIS